MQKNFKKAIFGVNDVYSKAPDSLIYWSSENLVSPKEITVNSNYSILAECPKCDYKWTVKVNKLVQHPRCSACRETILVVGNNDITTKYPDLAARFTEDSPVKPSEMTLRTFKKARVSCKHYSLEELRYIKNYIGYCKKCINRFVQRDKSVAFLKPEILKCVSPNEKLDLFTVPVHSTLIVLLLCQKGHEYPQKITSWSTGSGCPICLNIYIIPGVNDLASTHPEVARMFSTGSLIKPFEISSMSGKRALFECNKGHVWESIIANVTKGSGCEKCARSALISKKELEVLEFLKSLDYSIIHSDRSLIKPLEIDFLIPDFKIGIEFNGDYWHSDEVLLKSRGVTAKTWHQYKKDLARDTGYKLYFIWESDWNNSREEVKSSIIKLMSTGSESNIITKLEKEI